MVFTNYTLCVCMYVCTCIIIARKVIEVRQGGGGVKYSPRLGFLPVSIFDSVLFLDLWSTASWVYRYKHDLYIYIHCIRQTCVCNLIQYTCTHIYTHYIHTYS